MMQDAVYVIEDVPFGDGVVVVVGTELRECPIGDVLAAVGAVGIVDVERETLSACACTDKV